MLLPNNLTAKSVDSLAGKSRAIFRDMGRAGEWNLMLYTGNPASSHILKKHIQALTVEQLNANVVKNVATPLMFDKLGRLCGYLSYKVFVENNLTAKFVLSRDLSYFSFVCHSGNRGGHLSQIKAEHVFEIPDSDGIYVSQQSGKTASIDHPNNFVILPSSDEDICPIKLLKDYKRVAQQVNVDLSKDFMFRSRY